jgi:hypothetical protein
VPAFLTVKVLDTTVATSAEPKSTQWAEFWIPFALPPLGFPSNTKTLGALEAVRLKPKNTARAKEEERIMVSLFSRAVKMWTDKNNSGEIEREGRKRRTLIVQNRAGG